MHPMREPRARESGMCRYKHSGGREYTMPEHVHVIMGGPSAEHEVSLATGREVLLHLDQNKYHPRAVVMSRTRELFYERERGEIPSLDECAHPENSEKFRGPYAPWNSAALWEEADVVFMALHGDYGEDGRMQGYLDVIGKPYTGSGVFASAVSMNKIAAKRLFAHHGIASPPDSVYRKSCPETNARDIAAARGFPCFVKCPQSGSSRLMGRACTLAELETLLDEFSRHADEIMVESLVTGPEYSCPVLQYPDSHVEALPPVLIQPVQSDFFDFEAKYTDGACTEIAPAPCDEATTRRIQEAALAAHRLLHCEGLSRTDMIMQNDTLFVLEINTLPGLTQHSLAPKSFAAGGGTYGELLDVLLQTALSKRSRS